MLGIWRAVLNLCVASYPALCDFVPRPAFDGDGTFWRADDGQCAGRNPNVGFHSRVVVPHEWWRRYWAFETFCFAQCAPAAKQRNGPAKASNMKI